MARFFVEPEQVSEKTINIFGDDVKHIAKVLRLRIDEKITVCDKCGNDYECTIDEISSDRVVARIVSTAKNFAESDIEITLLQGLPKSDKMDLIIQKCVELGVSKIIPVITKRAVSRPTDGDKKLVRWQKISAEAAKQCGRGIIPEIGKIISFNDALKLVENNDALSIMPYECESEGKLRDVLKGADKKKVFVFIGPEGGFDEAEVIAACKAGVKTVTLGPRIMRTETAPLAVCSVIMYEIGDW